MSITAARLQAEVGADTKGFDSGMAHADRTIKSAPGKWATALKVGAGAALAVGGALVVRGIAGAIRGGLDSLTEQGVVVAQTNAAIRSTKGAANVSATAIRDLSTALEAKSGFDDKAIQSGANLLLTFTNIKNAAGAGNDIFDQSTEALTNMARAMGTDVKSGAIKLGKALNDPVKGLTSLTKWGVMFTAEQKAEIQGIAGTGDALKNLKNAGIDLTKSQKDLIKSYGPAVDTIAAAEGAGVKLTKAQRALFNGMDDGTGIIKAQKVILAELNKEFGKSNEEFMKTDAGKALLFQDAIEGVQQALTGALLPAMTRVRGALTDFLGKPETLAQVGALGDAIASIFSEGNLSMAANLMTTAAGAIGTAIKLFSALPPEVQALAVGALALKKITGIGPIDIAKGAGGVIKMVFERGSSPVNPLYVTGVGALGSPTGASPAGGNLLNIAKTLGALAIAGIAVEKLVEQWGAFRSEGAAGAETLRQQTSAGVPQLTLEQARAALTNTREQLGNPINDLALKLSGTFDQVKATEKALVDRIAYLERGGTGTGATGGRGDASTAAEVKRLGERQALAARIVAAGGKPTAARITAIMEKNVRTSISNDAREANRFATLGSTVQKSGAATTDAALATAAAIRAKQFTAYAQFKSTVLNNPDLNGPKKPAPYHPPLVQPKQTPVPVVLSPRLVPNSTRNIDLYGPIATRNGRATP